MTLLDCNRWPFENPRDQSRCSPTCSATEYCFDGTCFWKDDAGGPDSATKDSATEDSATEDSATMPKDSTPLEDSETPTVDSKPPPVDSGPPPDLHVVDTTAPIDAPMPIADAQPIADIGVDQGAPAPVCQFNEIIWSTALSDTSAIDLVVDNDGIPHAFYIDQTTGAATRSWRNMQGTWIHENIAEAAGSDRISATVDTQSSPNTFHVLYRSAATTHPYYIHQQLGASVNDHQKTQKS